MSSPQRPPIWLDAALSSQSYMTTVLSVLSDRERKRGIARNASRMRLFERSDSSRQFPVILRGRRSSDAPASHNEHYAIKTGSHPQHQDLNRYTDIVPYDRTRVVVYDGCLGAGDDSKGKYLNASWVLERMGGKWWIATQAPVKRSAHAFLNALMQPIINPPYSASGRSRVRTVVQLTRDFEGGRRKADAYFPSEVGESIVIYPDDDLWGHPLKVTLCRQRTIEEAHCIESTVSILPIVNGSTTSGDIHSSVYEEHPITFKHLLYLSWPDHGVPENHQSVLSFIRLVDQTNRATSSGTRMSSYSSRRASQEIDLDPPIMVGCSAGVGRTGSFIALTSLLRGYGFLPPTEQPSPSSVLPSSPLGPLPEILQVDGVTQEIDSLREQRPGMVQRPEQVLLVYKVLAGALSWQLI